MTLEVYVHASEATEPVLSEGWQSKRAYRDFLRHSLAELPDCDEYIWTLPLDAAEALRSAWPSKDLDNLNCLRVADEMVPRMQALGLVAMGGPYVGNFGKAVRKRLLDLEQ